jgi:hypothetical protein
MTEQVPLAWSTTLGADADCASALSCSRRNRTMVTGQIAARQVSRFCFRPCCPRATVSFSAILNVSRYNLLSVSLERTGATGEFQWSDGSVC